MRPIRLVLVVLLAALLPPAAAVAERTGTVTVSGAAASYAFTLPTDARVVLADSTARPDRGSAFVDAWGFDAWGFFIDGRASGGAVYNEAFGLVTMGPREVRLPRGRYVLTTFGNTPKGTVSFTLHGAATPRLSRAPARRGTILLGYGGPAMNSGGDVRQVVSFDAGPIRAALLVMQEDAVPVEDGTTTLCVRSQRGTCAAAGASRRTVPRGTGTTTMFVPPGAPVLGGNVVAEYTVTGWAVSTMFRTLTAVVY